MKADESIEGREVMPAASLVSEVQGAVVIAGIPVPPLFAPDGRAALRFVEFFTVHIRNPNTRRAYLGDMERFAVWCDGQGLTELGRVQPLHVAAFIEGLLQVASKPTVKRHLAAIRMLFDWLVVGQIMSWNPASVVRGPRHSTKKGKTPVLTSEEARELLDSIETRSVIGLRDRALIGVMTYTFARVTAAVELQIEDVYVQGRRTWLRLHEKGGKVNEMPAHHHLEEYLHQYLEKAGLTRRKGPVFRTVDWTTGELTDRQMSQSDTYRMIRRRAADAGIQTKIGNHTFRATGITSYLKNGGRLEVAQQMAAHESSRTTSLYDRRGDEINIEEVERIGI
jgi:site-specific recombinase XerD